MVKKMLVVFSALALIITAVGAASAYMPCGYAEVGDMIVVPMKVKTTYQKVTGPAGWSSFFMDGCQQYTAGFTPWGQWKGTTCTMKVQVIPPKCVAPAYGGPVAWGAPPAISPGCKLISNQEQFKIDSPGCNPCVEGGLQYEMVKKQVVK
jgi:hypothetical protein